MVPVDGPQVAFHQRILAELDEHVVAMARRRRSRELQARAREMAQLVAVLPEQLMRGHLVLVQLPDAEQYGEEPHAERQQILQRDTQARIGVMHVLAEYE